MCSNDFVVLSLPGLFIILHSLTKVIIYIFFCFFLYKKNQGKIPQLSSDNLNFRKHNYPCLYPSCSGKQDGWNPLRLDKPLSILCNS